MEEFFHKTMADDRNFTHIDCFAGLEEFAQDLQPPVFTHWLQLSILRPVVRHIVQIILMFM